MNPKQHLHGKVMQFNELSRNFPDRNLFLNNLDYKRVTRQIRRGEDILFMPNDVIETIVREENGRPSLNKYAPGYSKIFIAGVLTDGRKAIVMIDGIRPYLDVRVSKSYTDTINQVTEIFKNQMQPIKYESYDTLQGKNFKYNSKADFVRFYFRTARIRSTAIWKLTKFDTAHNEGGNDYYRIFARDHLKTLSDWVCLKNYDYINYDPLFQMKIFRVSTDNYCTYTGDTITDPMLSKDKLIELTWDIETCDIMHDPKNPSGIIPQPDNKEHVLFMIGGSIQYYWTPINIDMKGNRIKDTVDGELLNFCIVDVPTDPSPDKLTIVCGNEKYIIIAFAIITGKIMPDFIIGFNDGRYDWRWYVERAFQLHLLWILEKYMSLMNVHNSETGTRLNCIDEYKYYKHEIIKIDASTNADVYTLDYFGYINIDMCVQLRSIDPSSGQYNLKYFLNKNSLGSKVDMPYQTMFDIYINARRINGTPGEEFEKNKHDMMRVAHYCYFDALQCHNLLKRQNIILIKRRRAN